LSGSGEPAILPPIKRGVDMKNFKMIIAAGALVSGLSGCAMLNRMDVEYHRNTTIGQELLDLQQAREKCVISDEEYITAKKEILAGGPVIRKEKKK
jgi:hypothetical protein